MVTKSRQNNAKILDIIESYPLGITISELAEETEVPKRTLLRELKILIQNKQIVKIGKARATRYKRSTLLPVGYDFQFLRSYKPNSSSFLSSEEKSALLKMGSRLGNTFNLETFSSQIFERLIIDLSWSSSKLEGNTYSLLETEKLIHENQKAAGKDSIETQMILNHKEAIKFLTLNKKKSRSMHLL